MKTNVYLCRCGSNIADRINEDRILLKIGGLRDVGHIIPVDLMCSEEGKAYLENDLKERQPERVVIAACSPRDHETTFKKILKRSGVNPSLMQMTNIREQVAWVVDDVERATDKAIAYINGAVERVKVHEELYEQSVDACGDVLVLGAGPAGMKAALSIAEAGRKVILVERTPAIGGMPVLYEEIFPDLECGPCMLEPLMDSILYGEHSDRIELLTLAEVDEVLGFYGNFEVTLRRHARYIDLDKCIGCGECVEPCPVQVRNEFNFGLDVTKAVSFPFLGALPSAPAIDKNKCMRFRGEECTLCMEACPVPGAIKYDDSEELLKRKVGAVVVAVGASLYDGGKLETLGYGSVLGVYTSQEFERLLSSNGPTSGELKNMGGSAPESVCLVHCAGSLDEHHKEYCSGICCLTAFKFNHMIESRLPGTKIYHLYKEIVMPGKDDFALHKKATKNPNAEFIRYNDISDLSAESAGEHGNVLFSYTDTTGQCGSFETDMVVLCMAMEPAAATPALSEVLGIDRDDEGFFRELHGRIDAARTKIRGIYVAGTCRAPMNIQDAMGQGMASAGYILSGLVPGRKIDILPNIAEVQTERCSGCKLCVDVCPFKAIMLDPQSGRANVNAVMCQGCGICVAACPAKCIVGHMFTDEEILAEIRGVLA